MPAVELNPLDYATDRRSWSRYKVLLLVAGVLMAIGVAAFIYGCFLNGLN